VKTAIYKWFERRVNSFPDAPPEQPPGTLRAFLFYYAKPFWPLLIFVGVLSITASVLEVMVFSFVGSLVDWLSTIEKDRLWEDHSTYLLLMAGVVVVALPVISFVYESARHQGLLGNFAMRVRWQAHRYVLRQSLSFFQDDFAGRIATKVMQTALAARDVVLKIIDIFLYVMVYFTASVILFASADWRLMIPMLVWFVFYAFALWYFVPRLQVISMEQADHRSVVTGRIVDSYTNINTVKMFAHADREDAYIKEGMDGFLDCVYRQMRMSTSMSVILELINSLLLFSVAALAIWLWTVDAISVGAFALAVGLVLRFQGMSHWILWEVWALFEEIGTVQDGMETISRERQVLDKVDARPLKVTDGAISYQEIQFNYGKDLDGKAAVVEGLTLNIKPGQKVGVVGRSGAGKSTLVNLLLRFYDLERGAIAVDGQNIADITQDSLRAQIGMVTQEPSLMHRSVRDNIRYGKPDATEEEIIQAAKDAQAMSFITELADVNGRSGLEAHVGERGVKLSGGQRQRIAIARVLLKDAPILVLDEATSALDSEVEAAIQESLHRLMDGKTVIAIAHRLSTIAAMDRLIVMDGGKIVEDGSHEELLEQGGLYAQLWSRQSGGFLLNEEIEQVA